MGFPIVPFTSVLGWECWLKKSLISWLEQKFEHSSETSWIWISPLTKPLTRRRISILISTLFPLVGFFWALASDHENVRNPLVYCSNLSLVGISLLYLMSLPSIRKSDATKEESFFLDLSFSIFSTLIGSIINKAAPPDKFGLYLNCSYILWGFFLETPLGLKTKLGLVTGGTSLTIGFERALDWWCLVVIPICLNAGLKFVAWCFTPVIFPDDKTDLVLLLEREHQQLIPIIMEAIQKADEHLAVLNANLNEYEATKKAVEDVEKCLGQEYKDEKIHAVLLERERTLCLRMKEDRLTAKEYKAALYSILDKKKCVTSLVDYKTLKDEKIPVFLLGRVEKLYQLTTDAIRSADEYQDALSSILDANDCFATQLDALTKDCFRVLLQEMKQRLNQLEMEATGDAEGNAVASLVSIQTMEDADTGFPSPDMTELTSPVSVSGGDLMVTVGR